MRDTEAAAAAVNTWYRTPTTVQFWSTRMRLLVSWPPFTVPVEALPEPGPTTSLGLVGDQFAGSTQRSWPFTTRRLETPSGWV
jgi:hypothetical protein